MPLLLPLSNTFHSASASHVYLFAVLMRFASWNCFFFSCAFVPSITAFFFSFLLLSSRLSLSSKSFHFFSYLNSFLAAAPLFSAGSSSFHSFCALILQSESAWARWPLIVSSQSSSGGSILQHTHTHTAYDTNYAIVVKKTDALIQKAMSDWHWEMKRREEEEPANLHK